MGQDRFSPYAVVALRTSLATLLLLMMMLLFDLDGGGRYVGLITEVSNPEEVKIGTKVEMVLRRLLNDSGLDFYGYKFRLVEEA